MSDRIRNLEDGLQAIHSEHASHPDQPHPLMQPALLRIKSTMNLYSAQAAPLDAVDSQQQTSSTSKVNVVVPEHPPRPNQVS